MILTSSGDILTNNHVIDGATSISVTLVGTGRSYKAQWSVPLRAKTSPSSE